MKVPFKKLALSTCLIAYSGIALSKSLPPLEQLEQLFNNEEYQEIVSVIRDHNLTLMSEKQYTVYIYALSNIDLDDAEEAATSALGVFANSPDMYLVHASIMGAQAQDSIFSALGYAEKALTSLQKAVELAPNIPKYRLGLMSFYLAAPSIAGGDTDLALAQANKILELDELKGTVALSRYYYATDDVDNAVSIVNDVLSTHPNNAMLYNQLANVHTRNDNTDDAIIAYQKVADIGISVTDVEHTTFNEDEQDAELYRYHNSHYQIGRLAVKSQSHTETGITHLNTYLSLQSTSENQWDSNLPSSDWALLRLAELYLDNDQLVNARATYNNVTLDKGDSDMKSVYKKLAKKLKKAEKAI